MQYFNQTNLSEVNQAKEYMESLGFETSVSYGKATIIRETSKYNKYMKWHVNLEYENGSKSSQHFKTKPEAIRYLTQPRQAMPIGKFMSLSHVKLEV